MSRYTFDAVELRDRGRVIATVQGMQIRSRTDYRVAYLVRNGKVIDRRTNDVVFNINASGVHDPETRKRLAWWTQIDREIPEADRTMRAALWACFVHRPR